MLGSLWECLWVVIYLHRAVRIASGLYNEILPALRGTFCGGSVRDQGGATRASETWSTCLALPRCKRTFS